MAEHVDILNRYYLAELERKSTGDNWQLVQRFI